MKADGKTLASGKLPALDIAPREEKEYKLALPKIKPEPGAEYWLNFSFMLKHETPWAPRGHEIAWDQFALPMLRSRRTRPRRVPPTGDEGGGRRCGVRGKGCRVRFDKTAGDHCASIAWATKVLERGPGRISGARRRTTTAAHGRMCSEPREEQGMDIRLWREAGP